MQIKNKSLRSVSHSCLVFPEGVSADSVVQVAVQVHGHDHGSNLRKQDNKNVNLFMHYIY